MRILTTAKKLYCGTPSVERLFAKHPLVEHLSMAASVSINYRTVPSTIRPIFSEILIFFRLISRDFRRVK